MAGRTPELNVQRIVDEVRERVRYRQSLAGQLVAAPLPFLPLDGPLVEQLMQLTSSWNVYEAPIEPGRGIKGRALAVVKRALRRLLAPVLGRQVTYNAATMRIVAQLAEQLDVLASRHGDLLEDVMLQHAKATEAIREEVRREAADVRREVAELRSESRADLATLRGESARAITTAGDGLRERIARVERMMRRLAHAAEASTSAPSASAPAPSDAPPAVAFDYAGFEERFRGSEQSVQARQRDYVALFAGRERVVDLGCGRGEFLELLRTAGVPAIGVDSDLDMVLACREKGLDVRHDDLMAFLERQADGSLGGIFAAQVIEHLPSATIMTLVSLARRKLAPGAAIVLESPNPGCLTIFAASFYMDFTHLRPVHPDAMRFLLEAAGFEGAEIRYSSPVEQDVRFPPLPDTVAGAEFAARFNRAVDHANSLLYGCQDYAVVARRSAAQPSAAVA